MNHSDSVYNLMRTADIIKHKAVRKDITDVEINKINLHLTKFNINFTNKEIKRAYKLVSGL